MVPYTRIRMNSIVKKIWHIMSSVNINGRVLAGICCWLSSVFVFTSFAIIYVCRAQSTIYFYCFIWNFSLVFPAQKSVENLTLQTVHSIPPILFVPLIFLFCFSIDCVQTKQRPAKRMKLKRISVNVVTVSSWAYGILSACSNFFSLF